MKLRLRVAARSKGFWKRRSKSATSNLFERVSDLTKLSRFSKMSLDGYVLIKSGAKIRRKIRMLSTVHGYFPCDGFGQVWATKSSGPMGLKRISPWNLWVHVFGDFGQRCQGGIMGKKIKGS